MEAVAEDRPEGLRTPWPWIGVFVLALLVCYANSLHVPFVFDDPFLVADRPDVALDYATRPLVWSTFELNRAFGGRDTTGYHVFNALVHLGCGLLLFGLLRRTLALAAPARTERARDGLAAVTTLVWLVHPLQTESVTYLSQRAESLGALFTLLVLYAFVRGSTDERRPWAWFALAGLALALGFATKETVATAPLLVWLYDTVFLARGPWKALKRRPLFYAGLSLISLALGWVYIRPLLHTERLSAGFGLVEFSALDYARTQPGVILHYLRLAFWPHPLCLDYAWPIARTPGAYVLPAIVVLALALASLVGLLRRSWLGYAGVFFFVYLAPSSSFVPIRDPAVEHRFYLPLAALLVVVVLGLDALCARFARDSRAVGPALAGFFTLVLAGLTILRNQDYASGESLWRQTLANAPHNPRAHGNLGAALLEDGRVHEAIAELMQGLALAPDEGFILLDLGKAYWRKGDRERALSFLQRGVARTPDARGLGSLGSVMFEAGDFAGATLAFRKALALEPQDPGAHYRLANALAQGAHPEEALAPFREAVRLAPEFQEARINLAALLAHLGHLDEALAQSEAALATAPNTALELFNHAQLVASVGRRDDALRFLREAMRLDPSMLEPQAALAELLTSSPNPTPAERQEALAAARKAVELADGSRPEVVPLLTRAESLAGAPVSTAPTTPEDFFDMGQELRRVGRADDALAAFREARRLAPNLAEPRVALAETIAGKPDASAAERREARADAQRAVELTQPPKPEYLAVLALTQAALGDFEHAVASLDEALGLPATAANPGLAAQLRADRAGYVKRAGK